MMADLVKAGAIVRIGERKNYAPARLYFQEPVENWEEMRRDLELEGISLRLTSLNDENFINILCNTGIRACLTVMSVDCEKGEMLPAKVSRGYYP